MGRFKLVMIHDGGHEFPIASYATVEAASAAYKELDEQIWGDDDFEGCDPELRDTETGELWYWDDDNGCFHSENHNY